MTAPTLEIPAGPVRITRPGVYEIDAADYHRDPVPGGSLSSSGAKRLLDTCPAQFDHERRNPPEPKDEFDFGSAAHAQVLGRGAPLEVLDYRDWQTKKAQEQRREARAEGKIPILTKDHEVVLEMARALRDHPAAAALLDPLGGKPEQAMFWTDRATGVRCRSLVDWLRNPTDGRLILCEYKTCRDASPVGVAKALWDYKYHQRAEWYVAGAQALGLDAAPAMVLIFQEKTAPYLVNCVEPDAIAMRHGRDRNREALEIYAACSSAGRWPGYGDGIDTVSLPDYIVNRFLRENTW